MRAEISEGPDLRRATVFKLIEASRLLARDKKVLLSVKTITLSGSCFEVLVYDLLLSRVQLFVLLDQLLYQHPAVNFPDHITSKCPLNLEGIEIEVNLLAFFWMMLFYLSRQS